MKATGMEYCRCDICIEELLERVSGFWRGFKAFDHSFLSRLRQILNTVMPETEKSFSWCMGEMWWRWRLRVEMEAFHHVALSVITM